MKCTDCSKVVEPVVAVDIDGTLGDYHGHFIRFAAMYTGHDVPLDYSGNKPFKQWFLEGMPYEDERTWRDIKLAYRQGAMKRSMPVYDGATELCRAIREDAGAELWLTTTRPYLRLDNIDPDTRFWLKRCGIEYDGLLYDELKYERLAGNIEAERVVAVLDDLPEMFEAAGRLFGRHTPILRRTRYNRSVACDTVVETLEDAKHRILGGIEGWRSRHGA